MVAFFQTRSYDESEREARLMGAGRSREYESEEPGK